MSPVLRESEVVFMYGHGDPDIYRAFAATFQGWGGAATPERARMFRELGMRATGSIWCLTAGAARLHADAALRDAVVRDIRGEPVAVPWLADHVHEGTPSWFGCTNHPAFRRLNRDLAREAVSVDVDGLHIDDPRGSAGAMASGGCFCDYCMAAFREYAKRALGEAEFRAAGVRDSGRFDYREVVRAVADTREECLRKWRDLPLIEHFRRFQDEAAAENIRGIARAAMEHAGRKLLISVNAYNIEDGFLPIVNLDEVTHIVCEVRQAGTAEPDSFRDTAEAYERARRAGKPVAATATGENWAWVKKHGAIELPKIWIAFAYACGQRFMAPDPERQWCHTNELGTHWYAAPAEQYAPMYRFVRANADLFDGYAATAPPDVSEKDGLLTAFRARPGAQAVMHAVNLRCEPGAPGRPERIQPRRNLEVPLPPEAAGAKRARLMSFDAPPETVRVRRSGGRPALEIPELRIWTIAALE